MALILFEFLPSLYFSLCFEASAFQQMGETVMAAAFQEDVAHLYHEACWAI